MYKELDITSRVPSGKYKSTIVGEKLIKDKKEIFALMKDGYVFSRSVMEKAGFKPKINNVKFTNCVVEHEQETRLYEKDTMVLKNILKSLHTIHNSEIEETNNENKNEEQE